MVLLQTEKLESKCLQVLSKTGLKTQLQCQDTRACLPSYFSWYLPLNIYSILLSSPAKLSRKILCRKSCSFDTVSNFPQGSRQKKTCRAITTYTTVCQVTDRQIFFRIQTAEMQHVGMSLMSKDRHFW